MRTGSVILQSYKREEPIWAALQELPMGLSSCLEDCQTSWWFGRNHAVARGHALDDLVLDGGSRRMLQHASQYMISSYF